MPFFRIDHRWVYYAHVPKCGGSAIANYVHERFGALAFHDNSYLKQLPEERWTASSPQHIDATTLERLIPLSFFSVIFTIVRHPVGRAISTYHFQLELERSIPVDMNFTDWLRSLQDQRKQAPFLYDNHTRPMSEIVPEGATVFYMEHGLDALVPWFDALCDTQKGPRAIMPENVRGDYVKTSAARVSPTETDIALIGQIYAADFKRFGYLLHERTPKTSPPEVTADFLATRDKALSDAMRTLAIIRRKIRKKIWRM